MSDMAAADADAGDAVVREIWVAAKPDTVFPFLTDASKITEWMGESAEIDPRPGGKFRVAVHHNSIASGEMIEIDRPKRVVFSWGWEGGEIVPPGASTVEVTLTDENDGTRVRLVHRGLSGEPAKQHGIGWAHYLERLGIAAGGGDAGPDPWNKKD